MKTLIENLQDSSEYSRLFELRLILWEDFSDLESIDPSSLGEILFDLTHHAAIVAQASYDTTDLLSFLSYASRLIHILRTILAHKCSDPSSDPHRFLQCQYLIDILHSSEFIVQYLSRYHRCDRAVLITICTDLSEIFSSMKRNMSSCQSICQSLFCILDSFNQQQMSS